MDIKFSCIYDDFRQDDNLRIEQEKPIVKDDERLLLTIDQSSSKSGIAYWGITDTLKMRLLGYTHN